MADDQTNRALIPVLVTMMLLTGVCNTLLTKYQVRLPVSFPAPKFKLTSSSGHDLRPRLPNGPPQKLRAARPANVRFKLK